MLNNDLISILFYRKSIFKMVHRERPSSKHIMLKRNASHDSWIEGEREKPIESIDRRQQTRARSPKKSEDSSR